MDILNLFAASGSGLSAFVLFGVMGMALTVFIAGAALALKANRSASESRLALADAEVKLATASELAEEVRSLRAQVEAAVVHHNEAVQNARLMHNDACAERGHADHGRNAHAGTASDFEDAHETSYSKRGEDLKNHHSAYAKGGKHDDDHKKHHSAFAKGGKHDDDHKKHHSAFAKGGKHDDHKKHHSARDESEREHKGFVGWFFDR
jgi:hypothetical protein